MDMTRFFAGIRLSPMFGGWLTQSQGNGVTAIVTEAQARGMADAHTAYCLATAFHETNKTMLPIKEFGGSAYFHKMYDPGSPDANRADLARRNGALPGDGVIFFGRGYVQLTWRPNYVRMSKLTGVDLVANPDKVLDPALAARIMFEGMTLGLFTGKKLSDYLQPGHLDWFGARRIINGTDKADVIAEYARTFNLALLGS